MLDLENFPDVGINLDTMLFGKEKEPKIEDDITKTIQVKQTINKHEMRRIVSELRLEKELLR